MEEDKEKELREPILAQHRQSQNDDLLTDEKAFEATGGFGVFQVILVISLFISFCYQGLISYNLYLFELEPEYLCQFTENGEYVPCYAYERDDAYKWKLDYSRNDLNLDNWYTRLSFHTVEYWKIGMIGTIYFIGYMAGSIYFPRLADVHGRKPFVVIGGFLQSFCTLLLYFSKSLNMIYINMFFIGVASPFLSSIGYNYLIEFIPERAQNLVNTLLMCLDACGSLFGILYFTYFSHNIDYFLIGCIVLGFGASFVHVITPESPRFYLSTGQFDEAREVFQVIGQYNSKEFPRNKVFEGEHSVLDDESHSKKELHTSMADLFFDCNLLTNILVMIAVWSTTSAGYYLINFNMKYIGGTIINNIFASVTSEIVASLVASMVFEFMGSKKTLILFFLISAISGGLFVFEIENSHIITFMILVSKFGISAAYCLIYITTAKMFPPVYSATAFGMCNIFARITTALTPLIIELPPPYPMLFLSASCFIVCLLIPFLKKVTEAAHHENEIEILHENKTTDS